MCVRNHDWKQRIVLTIITIVSSLIYVIHGSENDCVLNVDGTCITVEVESQQQQQPYCSLYMAESTIPGAGIGIFTIESKEPGDIVGNGDICIPLIDMYWHNNDVDNSGNSFFNPFYDYFWSGSSMGMSKESNTNDIEALCPGLDCAINCNLALLNVEKSTPIYDDSNLHRSIDPGVGTYSPYGNGTTYVSRSIPPGGELFKFYGDHWFTVRKNIFGLIPLSDDYPAISKLLKKMIKKLSITQDETKLHIFHDLYTNVILNTINTNSWESRLLNALPKNSSDAIIAGNAGDIAVIHQPGAMRDPIWLSQNGKCIDHIISGQSTIQQAGHGAFAKRYLPKDAIITSSPLHHLPHYNFMNMYNFTHQTADDGETILKNKWYRLLDEIRHYQLLYNYCFGHPKTTLLLCPYGANVNYINHNQTLANVKIQWATKFDIVHSDTVVNEGTINDLAQSTRPKLAFDYVATRNIQQGEELFLDYGDVWEEAWNEHVESYTPYHDSKYGVDPKQYSSGKKFNELFGQLPLRTDDEQKFDPYPSNLQIRCHRSLLKKKSNPNMIYKWQGSTYGLPCRILDRFIESDITTGTEILYTVQIEWTSDDEDDEDDDDDDDMDIPSTGRTVTWIERTDVPRSAFQFFDLPYTTDMHLTNAFRHEIQIPDSIMPEQWKNL